MVLKNIKIGRFQHKSKNKQSWITPVLCLFNSKSGIPITTSIPVTDVIGIRDEELEIFEKDDYVYLKLPDGQEINTEVSIDTVNKWDIHAGSIDKYYERIKNDNA